MVLISRTNLLKIITFQHKNRSILHRRVNVMDLFFFLHYANMFVQNSAIFHGYKNDYFQMKNCYIFLIFAQNIDCGYTLEPPQ